MSPSSQIGAPSGGRRRGQAPRACATRTSPWTRCPERGPGRGPRGAGARGALLALLLAAWAAWAPTARAAPDDAAARYREGRALFEAGRLPEALEAFQAAYQRRPLPRLLYLIGQVHLRMGQLEQATASLEAFLAAEPALPRDRRQAIEALLSDARRQLAGRAPAPSPRPAAPGAGTALASAPRPAAPTSPVAAAPRPAAPGAAVAAGAPPAGGSAAPAPAAPRAAAALPAAALGAPLPALPRAKPLHRRWWLWTGVAAVAAGAVVTTAVLSARAARGAGDLQPIALCDWPGPCPAKE